MHKTTVLIADRSVILKNKIHACADMETATSGSIKESESNAKIQSCFFANKDQFAARAENDR